MIKVEKLTKIYNPETKNEVRAIKKVTFTLSDSGLVFIVGKSGSGKSTLLNMLGGLDVKTYGEITVDGNKLSKLSVRELDDYRNNYIGFVFQNFCLIDNYDVYENININSYLTGKDISNKISPMLEKYGLKGYEHRRIHELSGGECQRIAVIRALIKNPHMILADEPTGNLDSKSSLMIFDTLKEISKDRLVVVISHDMENAYKYADRIIELADGKILSDKVRNSEFIKDDSNKIFIPENTNVSEEDFININKDIEKYNLKLVKEQNEFISLEVSNFESEKKVKFEGKSNLKTSIYLAKKFMKKNIATSIVSIILVSLIVVLLCITQMFRNFSVSIQCKEQMERGNLHSFNLTKGYSRFGLTSSVSTSNTEMILDEEIDKFYEGYKEYAAYEGNIYKLYNQPLITYEGGYHLEQFINLGNNEVFSNIYSISGYGTVNCTMDFLKQTFGENIKVLSGSLDNMETSTSLIVTDYFADSILHYNQDLVSASEDKYANLTDGRLLFSRYKIGAIIDSSYKDRYQDTIDEYNRIMSISSRIKREKDYNTFSKSEMYYDLMNEGRLSLNVAYSINPNFYEDFVNDLSQYNHSYIQNIEFYKDNRFDNGTRIRSYSASTLVFRDESLSDGEIYMDYRYYNAIYNTEYTPETLDTFTPTKIYVKYYEYHKSDDSRTVLSKNNNDDITYNVIKLTNNANGNQIFTMSNSDFKLIKQQSFFAYGLYFDNYENAEDIYYVGYYQYYYSDFDDFHALSVAGSFIDIFDDLFILMVLLFGGIALLLVSSHASKNVKNNRREIGILRALGAKTSSIAISFAIEVIALCLVSCIVSLTVTYLLCDFTNELLKQSFAIFMWENITTRLNYLTYDSSFIAWNLAIVWSIGLLSILSPLIPLRKIAPNKIIKE